MKPFAVSRTPQLRFGVGELARLGEHVAAVGASRVVVVVSSAAVQPPSVREAVERSLTDSGIEATYARRDALPGELDPFDPAPGAYAEASPDVVDAIVAACPLPHAVIAIGGGSALDTGKALSAAYVEECPIAECLEGVGTRQPSGRKLPFLAVPTTAGTGSEATANAVLSRTGPEGFKKSLRHPALVPDVALIDPSLGVGCSRAQTAASGLDAITQLLEAYTSTEASPLTDALALEGLAAAGRSYPVVVDCDATDLQARSGMAYAAYLSGVCLASAGLGTVHGLAGPAGALSSVPHGVFCGTLLPIVVEATADGCAHDGGGAGTLGKLATAGRVLCGTSGVTPDDQIRALVERLKEYLRIARLPALSSYGIDADLARVIAEAGDNKRNPYTFNAEQRRALLLSAL